MRIDWDVPIEMDDGLVLRADVFRPIPDGKYPVILSYGPYAKGLAFQDGYPNQWQLMTAAASGRSGRLNQQISELGSRRSGKVGAGRLRLRARGLARLRLLAGIHRSLLAARDKRFLQLHRVGGNPAMEQRQGRPQRHFLLRDQPVARGVASTAAPGGDVHLGRRRRLVPRHDAPRRHSLHVSGRTGTTCR